LGAESSLSAAAPSSVQSALYRPNTNLEQISDWLTKILVGVGLTQLAQVRSGAAVLSEALKPVLGNTQASGPFGVAVVFDVKALRSLAAASK
jgi:hypothetical protein